jgi:hypothetical protein
MTKDIATTVSILTVNKNKNQWQFSLYYEPGQIAVFEKPKNQFSRIIANGNHARHPLGSLPEV